jgi:hypothetical protein
VVLLTTGGIYQGNVLRGSGCSSAFDFMESGGDPSIVTDNDFRTGATLYLDGTLGALTTPEEINALPGAYSGNFSSGP